MKLLSPTRNPGSSPDMCAMKRDWPITRLHWYVRSTIFVTNMSHHTRSIMLCVNTVSPTQFGPWIIRHHLIGPDFSGCNSLPIHVKWPSLNLAKILHVFSGRIKRGPLYPLGYLIIRQACLKDFKKSGLPGQFCSSDLSLQS